MCPRPLSWPAIFQGAIAARPSKARFTVNFLRVDYLPLLSVTAFFTFIPVKCSRARYYFISHSPGPDLHRAWYWFNQYCWSRTKSVCRFELRFTASLTVCCVYLFRHRGARIIPRAGKVFY